MRSNAEKKMTSAWSQGKSFDWCELAALLPNGRMVRDNYVRRSEPAETLQWRRRFHNTNVFSSIGSLMKPDNNSICILPWYFDIDCPEDLPATRESAITLCQLLMDRTQIPQESLDIFFSGSKGFHVVVVPEVFRAFYSPYTLGLYRRMAQKAAVEGVRFLDTSVYTRRRLWRLNNSRHGKSGLFKTALTYEELKGISIEGIKKLATSPRDGDTLARHSPCEEAAAWYKRAITAAAGLKIHPGRTMAYTKSRRGWRMPPCLKAIEAGILPDGLRHHTYFALARAYRTIGMHPDEIRERLEALDSRHPIRDPDYIGRAVEWGCAHPGFPGCQDDSLRRYCRPQDCFYAKLKNNTEGK